MPNPEAIAREQIDAALEEAGWRVQDSAVANLFAAEGVAIREFSLARGYLGYRRGSAIHLEGFLVRSPVILWRCQRWSSGAQSSLRSSGPG